MTGELTPSMREFLRRFSFPIVLFIGVLVLGSLGYYLLWRPFDATWLDAIYMTFITVTTVGYNEIYPLNGWGRVLTIIVAITGIASLFYLFTAVMEFLVARQLRDPYGRQEMQKRIDTLSDHVILAGFGRMGQRVAEELREEKAPFVIVDKNAELEPNMAELDYLLILGDAEEDEVLNRAGITRAKSLIAATGTDAENAFIVMSARALNPELLIVARADEDAAMRKLQKAGADRTLNPYAIAGQRLVNMVIRPAAIDSVNSTTRTELDIETFSIPATSPFIDQSLEMLSLRDRAGVNVIAVLRDNASITNPALDLVLRTGDHLITLGTQEAFAKLKDLASEALTEAPLGDERYKLEGMHSK